MNLKSPIKFQLNDNEISDEDENLKLQNKHLHSLNQVNVKQIIKQNSYIEQLITTCNKLNEWLQSSNLHLESSIKNYFSFIEFYKNMQNIIWNENSTVKAFVKTPLITKNSIIFIGVTTKAIKFL